MTQDERFEKWAKIAYQETSIDPVRDAWHAALEPEELEWEPPDVNHVDENEGYELKWYANVFGGRYEIVAGMVEQEFEAWWFPYEKEDSVEFNDEYVVLFSVNECKKWCQDHYRRAAREIIDKLTGCEE